MFVSATGEGIVLSADPLAKRLFDIIFALIGVLLMAPVLALVSLLIWLDDGFPILLLQERMGKNGNLFNLFKFRTMKEEVEGVRVIEDRESDSRITRIGKTLRATAMDELPQLLNILKGDMSFVGPRALPLLIEDREQTRYRTIREVEGYNLRSIVRPGLTGIAQIFAPKDLPRRQKFRYDLLYIRKWSVLLDLKLIVVSVWITLRGKWEIRQGKI